LKCKRKTYITFAADVFLAVILGGKSLQGGFDDTTTEAEDQMESRLFLNVVVRKGAAVLQLLAGKDQTLLVGGNSRQQMLVHYYGL